MKKIVCSGEILVEIMAERTGENFLDPVPLIGPFPSGAPAIFIGQAAALGQPAGLIGAVGGDDFGTLNIERLRLLGADISAIVVHKDAATGTAFVIYRDDGSRHFVFNIRNSAAGMIELGPEAQALLATADHFHVMGSSLTSDKTIEVALAGVKAVKAAGGTVSFDPNVRREIMGLPATRAAFETVLAQTDIFMPSGDEIFLFSTATDEAAACADMLARGMSAIVIKRGAAGSALYTRDGYAEAPGFKVEEIDPTGAGDCFGAAFVSLWLRGTAPADALRISNACGALAVTRKGPMEGIFRMDEVEAFLRTAETGATA